MYTLGINAAYHDSSACLVRNGEVLAAVEEERFTRIKHAKRPIPFSAYELPYHAIDYCLSAGAITLADVDHVAYGFNPYLLLEGQAADTTISLPLEPGAHPVPSGWESPWDPLFVSYLINAPRHLRGGVPHHLQARFPPAHPRWHWVTHHLAHAASAFFPSPFEEAAIMTLDGRGERATTWYGVGLGRRIDAIAQVDYPHSLGLLYEQVTDHLGFLRSSDEYKVMALASSGRPAYADVFRRMVHLQDRGGYRITAPSLDDVLGPRRARGGPIEQRHHDIAHSLQCVLEEVVLVLAEWLRDQSGLDTLCLAGGVALNCVLNARLRDSGLFQDLWVQPAAGDAGTALGAALFVDAQQGEPHEQRWRMDHAYLGPCYTDLEIEDLLQRSRVPYARMDRPADEVASLLAADLIVGWFQGRMEFGPRALGARSILASPLNAAMQARLNDIKDREDFRPVAPAVLEEEAGRWFRNAGPSPFMLFVHDVLPDRASTIPAVRHVDGTARIQTVRRDQNPAYYDLIQAFARRTGVPVLINTSFNTRGKPVVCSPRDALECFWTSPLDALAIGSFLLRKGAQ